MIPKQKNILYSIGLNISENKEFIEEELKKKFNVVEFIENMVNYKIKKTLYVKLFREIYKAFPNVYFIRKVYDKVASLEYKKTIKSFDVEFDYFLVISNGKFSDGFIKELRKKNPNIKTILFLWDKLIYTGWEPYISSFDYVFTFDRADALEYGFHFRPTFFTNYNFNRKIDFQKRENTIYYVGLLRDVSRYSMAKKLSEYMKEKKQKYLIKIFVPNKKRKMKVLPENYDKNLIINEEIEFFQDLENIRNSKVVLDLNYKKQVGLTLRAINAIESNTKILTNNKDIVNYDFYNEKNVFIIENIDDIDKIDSKFFNDEPVLVEEEIVQRYSMDGFLSEIFDTVNSEKSK